MAIQVGFPQTSQDLITLHAAAAFPPSSLYPQHYHNDTLPPNLPVSPSLPIFQFENHDPEIDHHIKLQGEKLSMKLREQRRQQVATILNAVELNVLHSMRRKDEEIARVARERMELQGLLNRVEAENQAWRRAALESEAMILSLNNSLEKMKEEAHRGGWADEAQSCCDESGEDYKQMPVEATGENAEEDDEHIKREMAASACKSCNCGRSCLLFLPCRHLCACEACEPFLQACPVCAAPKKASIEALTF